MKTCTSCMKEKPESEFSKDSRAKSGLQARCKACEVIRSKSYYDTNRAQRIEYAAQWRQENPNYQSDYDKKYREKNGDKVSARDRLRTTGWSLEQFEQAWTEQKGKCAICSVSMKKKGKSFDSVTADHCHKTGILRKLLCSKCNLMLGHADDSIRRLKAAIAYLS